MAKTLDITDKLSFDSNPKIVVKGKELEVNADAPTMLKVMGLMGGESPGMDDILKTYELMFSDKAQKEIEKLKLNFNDLVIVIQEAVQLIVGDSDGRGE